MTKIKFQIFQISKVAVIAICLAVTMFASCKKNQKDTEQDVFLLEERRSGGNIDLRHVYEYDNQDRMTKCFSYIDGQSFWISTLVYNTYGDLVELINEDLRNTGNIYKNSYFKNGNKITIEGFNNNPTIELNVQGFPVKLTFENKESGNWSEFILIWQNGNLIEEEWIDVREGVMTEGSTTYTHDDKKSPFYHCKTPKWYVWWSAWEGFGYWNKNNLETITGGGKDGTCEYTYNNDGFPVTSIVYRDTTMYTYRKK